MNKFNTHSTVADIVTQSPSSAAIFEQLGIDFCCGGNQPLSEAAKERGLDPDTLLATLNAVGAVQGAADGAHAVQEMTSAQLVDHIVSEHHAKVRKQLPMISELLDTVVRVHGEQDASLATMREQFSGISDELTEHMQVEEEKLFPVCRKVDEGEHGPVDPELLHHLSHEHAELGQALAQLHELGGGYDQERAHCNTHRFLLQSLSEFEEDLHVHIHEENNVLFPRTRSALEAANAG